ncbi:MAG TPA: DUF935 family protein [Candidatus Paceibacterota bacterium]
MPKDSSIDVGKQTSRVTGSELGVTTTLDTPLDASPTKDIKAHANLLESYVASTGSPFTPWMGTNYIRQLPSPTDDLMRDFGTRLYDEDMCRDPQVYSTLSILVLAVLCEGLEIFPALPGDDPDYDQAAKIADFCDWNLKNLRHPILTVLYELTEGMLKMGHKTAEMEYDLRDNVTPNSGPQIILSDIACKAHNATAFVVDGYNHVLGMLYIAPGTQLPVLDAALNSLVISGKQVDGVYPDMLPRSKFVIPTHKPRDNDPRGTSHLKAIYTPWWKKQQIIPQHLAYVARFAQPSIWAKIAPDAKDIPVKDASGNITSYKSIVGATTDALSKLKSGAVASVINTDIAMLEARSEGQVIFSSLDHEDRQIAKGILMQTLTTEESQHMARAASSVHQDVFGIQVAFVRSIIVEAIEHEILKPLILYNFGEDAADRLIPIISLGETDRQDMPQMINSISNLALAGGVHPSQWPGLWRLLDFPPVDEGEWQLDQQILEAKRKNDLELAKNPPPVALPGGAGSAAATPPGGGLRNQTSGPKAGNPTLPPRGPQGQGNRSTPTQPPRNGPAARSA